MAFVYTKTRTFNRAYIFGDELGKKELFTPAYEKMQEFKVGNTKALLEICIELETTDYITEDRLRLIRWQWQDVMPRALNEKGYYQAAKAAEAIAKLLPDHLDNTVIEDTVR